MVIRVMRILVLTYSSGCLMDEDDKDPKAPIPNLCESLGSCKMRSSTVCLVQSFTF